MGWIMLRYWKFSAQIIYILEILFLKIIFFSLGQVIYTVKINRNLTKKEIYNLNNIVKKNRKWKTTSNNLYNIVVMNRWRVKLQFICINVMYKRASSGDRVSLAPNKIKKPFMKLIYTIEMWNILKEEKIVYSSVLIHNKNQKK